jgi:hypothetical protein
MKKYITAAFMLLAIATLSAQNNNTARADSVLLSVYNTGSQYRINAAKYGGRTPTGGLILPMVAARDIHSVPRQVSVAPALVRDSAAARLATAAIRAEIKATRTPAAPAAAGQRLCSIDTTGLRGKIAVIRHDVGCGDVTDKCFAAQNAGAKAVLVIFPTLNRETINMNGGKNAKDLTIPCYGITQDRGDTLTALLPSNAGIIIPRVMPPTANSVVSDSMRNQTTAQNQKSQEPFGTTVSTDNAVFITDGTTESAKNSFGISPNPTHQQATVTYQYSQPRDVTFEVKTASGQIIFSQLLRGLTIGTIDVPTTDYPNGTYFVSLQHGKEVQTKKLVVQH